MSHEGTACVSSMAALSTDAQGWMNAWTLHTAHGAALNPDSYLQQPRCLLHFDSSLSPRDICHMPVIRLRQIVIGSVHLLRIPLSSTGQLREPFPRPFYQKRKCHPRLPPQRLLMLGLKMDSWTAGSPQFPGQSFGLYSRPSPYPQQRQYVT